ncbi:MAG: putative glycolipid-binding domain-containing protein [Actinomycetota bacterium]
MPAGTYKVFDGSGRELGTEEFRTAPGIAGSRYFSTVRTSDPVPHEEVVDLSVDSEWRPVRVRIETGEHHLILQRSGSGLAGARDGDEMQLGPVADFDYFSPAFNAATANRLAAEGLSQADLDVTWIEPFTLEVRTVKQRYERADDGVAETPVGRFEATRWRYTSLDSGWSGDIWVAGSIVVSYPGLFELSAYDPIGAGPFPLS